MAKTELRPGVFYYGRNGRMSKSEELAFYAKQTPKVVIRDHRQQPSQATEPTTTEPKED